SQEPRGRQGQEPARVQDAGGAQRQASGLVPRPRPEPQPRARGSMSTAAPSFEDPAVRAQLIQGPRDFHAITERVAGVVEAPTVPAWKVFLCFTLSLVLVLAGSLYRLVAKGIGVWGENTTIDWAWDITGFVFWVGIGHAGTLISAILFLFRQKWRTSINRAAEAMTIFAVVTALQYPLFHTGRPWFAAYWLLPIPNQMEVWPNFRSPLLWDVFAVSTYGTVSILFWYVGLVPDVATFRDRSKSKVKQFLYGVF